MNKLKLYEEFFWNKENKSIWKKTKKNPILYLSEEQPLKYEDGDSFDVPWDKKYYVLTKKDDKYYIIGDFRFSNSNYQLFFDYNNDNKLYNKLYNGEIFRPLTDDEYSDYLSKKINHQDDF